LFASIIFFKAGLDATLLYYNLGQMMELELDIPIWWMYLSFPIGFLILGSFALELTFKAISDLKPRASEAN
jgi:TRAP-type C4-dicarboxylate transport system permease small subunit